MNIKALLFDLDGTLLDTAPDFIECVNQLRSRHGEPPLPGPVIRSEVSNGARALTRLAFNLSDDSEHLEPLRQELLSIYTSLLGKHSTLFPGMDDTLRWIDRRGMGWGIVTNKPSLYTLPLLASITLPTRPATIVCPDHVTHTKPHPEPLLLACQQAGCRPGEAIYFGDHLRDIEAGKAAGMPTVSCGWGYLPQGEDCQQWHATYHLDKPGDIPALLASLSP